MTMKKLSNDEIKHLSRQEKLDLIDALEEREKRLKLRKAVYKPNPGQLPVHMSRKQIRATFSGNGAGKTCMGALEAIWAAEGYHPIRDEFTPAPTRGIIVLDNPDKVADVWLLELKKWTVIDEEKQCQKRGKPYYTRIIFDNGSEILFMFHDQQPMRFESIEADWIIFDEPPPKKLYTALMRGQRKLNSEPWMLFLGTPITAAWMRKEIWEPWSKGEADHIDCFKFSTDVNKKNINWEHMENVFFKTLSEQELRIRRHGEFFDLEGLALAHLWETDVHVIESFEWPSSNPVVVAVDPHPSKNHVASMLGTDREGYLTYIKEMSIGGIDAAPERFAYILNDFLKGYRLIDLVCDSLGSTPRTGGDGNKSFIEKLNEVSFVNSWGWTIRATTYQEKNDEEFIENLREVLEIPENTNNFGQKIPKLRVFSENRGIITDIENVEWQKWNKRDYDGPKDKLEIGNKDYLATLKYCLATNISIKPVKRRAIRSRPSPWGAKGVKRR